MLRLWIERLLTNRLWPTRLWNTRCVIILREDAIALLKTRGWHQPRIIYSQMIALDAEASGPASLQALVDALGQQLMQPEWQGCKVKVVLTGDMVRYRLAPWDARLSSAERLALVTHQLEQIYGEQMHGWHVSLAEAGFQQNSLACAVDQGFMEKLQHCFKQNRIKQNRIKLETVEPSLVTWINRFRKQIPSDAWMVIIDSKRLYLVRIVQGQWQLIRDIKVTIDTDQALEQTILRELLASGEAVNQRPVCCFWTQHRRSKPEFVQLKNLIILSTANPVGPEKSLVVSSWGLHHA